MKPMTSALAIGGIGILGALVGVFGTNVVAALGAQTKHYGIKLVPIGGAGGKLKVDKANQCANDKHEGCLVFETNKVGQIKFYLPGSQYEMKKCDGTKKRAGKVITKVELADESLDDDPTKGDFGGPFPLDNWLKYDAFPAVDLDDGIVYEAPWNKAATQVFLENLNSHKAGDGIKSFWYRVTVTDCDEYDEGMRYTWVTDPRGDNKGLN
jgi:hypothetical protein